MFDLPIWVAEHFGNHCYTLRGKYSKHIDLQGFSLVKPTLESGLCEPRVKHNIREVSCGVTQFTSNNRGFK